MPDRWIRPAGGRRGRCESARLFLASPSGLGNFRVALSRLGFPLDTSMLGGWGPLLIDRPAAGGPGRGARASETDASGTRKRVTGFLYDARAKKHIHLWLAHGAKTGDRIKSVWAMSRDPDDLPERCDGAAVVWPLPGPLELLLACCEVAKIRWVLVNPNFHWLAVSTLGPYSSLF